MRKVRFGSVLNFTIACALIGSILAMLKVLFVMLGGR